MDETEDIKSAVCWSQSWHLGEAMTSVAEKEVGELQERKAVTELEAARPSLTVSEQTKGGSQGIPLPPPTPPHQQGFELGSSNIAGAQASGHRGRAPNPASSRLCGRDEQSGFHSNRLWLSLGDLDSSPPHPPTPNPTSILSGDLALLQSCHTISARLWVWQSFPAALGASSSHRAQLQEIHSR